MIKVYTTKTCPNCLVAKSYLLALGYEYDEVIVNTPEMIEHVVAISGGRTVPVIEQDGFIIRGFDREEIKKLVK